MSNNTNTAAQNGYGSNFGFVPTTKRFNWQNAYSCALLSKLVYRGKNGVESTANTWGLDAEFIKVRNIELAVFSDAAYIIVAFRGTTNLKDWRTNSKFRKKKFVFGSVHRGFLTGYNLVAERMEQAIARFDPENAKPIWFTGHSLGAALAGLGATSFLKQERNIYGYYNFGMPRLCSRATARKFNQKFKSQTFRFVNHADIVTLIPLITLGYHHIGTLRFFDAKGRYHAKASVWRRMLARARSVWKDIGKKGLAGVRAHDMDLYIQNIKKKI